MRRLILALALILFASFSEAIESPMPLKYSPSGYTVDQTLVLLTSYTVTTLNSEGAYYDVQLSTPNATYYYTLDGLTTGVTTYGYPVLNGSTATIKGPFPINLKLGPSGTAQYIRKIGITPNR